MAHLPDRRSIIRAIVTGAAAPALTGRAAHAMVLPQPERVRRYDVVVVGTGLAGLAAALEAAENGAKVAIIEKRPEDQAGGNSRISGGSMIVPAADTTAARDDFVGDLLLKTRDRGNRDLFRVLADHAMEDIAWLKAHGCEFVGPNPLAPLHVQTMQIAPRQFVGVPKLMATLKQAITDKGGAFAYQTKAKQLLVDQRGRVSGVRTQDSDGLIDFAGGAVILATGGYAANRELLEGFVDPNADAMVVRGVKWATGDGLMMATEIGAGASNMGGLTSLHVACVSPEQPAFGIPDRGLPFCLAVNVEGKRFEDESIGYVANGKATLKQPRQTCALVFDEEIAKEPRVKTSVDTFHRLGLPILQAASLADLAQQMKMPVAQFEETVNSYNAAVSDQQAMKVMPPKAALAFKLEHPSFYAFYPLVPGVTMSFGGLMIASNGQVLERDGNAIGGLFAAGELAGALFYDDYIGGAMLTNCLVMGRQAGRAGAKA